MISENKRTNSMMDWNIRPSPDSSLQAKNIEFQGARLEQRFPAASSSSALQPILPKLSNANKGFGPSKHLQNMPPVSLSGSAVFVQMTPSATQNSNMMRNVHSSSCVVLQDGTVNPVQNIPQKRANPYMAMENYNNQPQQINSNSVRMSVYQQGCKNSLSPKNQPTLTPYIYVNGPSVSQVGAAGPLNSSSSHYLNSQQNFAYTILPIGQNIQNQINGQNPSMAATVQSQQYASDVNNVPYNMPTHCDKRNAIQISSYTVPIQVTNKPPPAYRGPPVQTNNGQFSLPQSVTNISNENVQNYHRPMPDLNTASYSAHCVQKGQSTRETNAVGSIAYNVSERGSGNQLSNESTKSSVEFRDNLLSSVQLHRIVSADEALTQQTSQTFEPQKKPGNVPVNFPDNPLNVKITKESLARDYKKFKAMKHVLLKLGEAYSRKREIFLSTQENKQASDPSDHNQNLNKSSHSITQNGPVADPALQFTSQDANKNQSSSPASYDSNQIKAVPLLPQKTGSHLLPILRNLLEGTDDENMLFNAFFEKEVTRQNGQLVVDESSSRNLSVTSGEKSKYSVNNTASNSRLSPQISQMNPTQEPLPCIKNDMSLMQTSSSTSHQLEKVNATSGTGSLHHFKLKRDALETLREYISCRLENLVQNSEKGITENIHDSQSVCPISVQKQEKNIRTGDEHVYDASSSASDHSKRVAVMQEADNVQTPTVSADSFRNGGICSLEELKTSLDLWRKSLPTSLNGQLQESTQSTGSLSSSEGGENDKKTQQSLENPTSTFAQNDQAKVTSGSDETTHSSVSISLEKNHDAVSSNLSKYSEPQVAIVTPLMLPKENIQIALHKDSSSLEITCPLGEEGRVHGLQKFLSTVPQNDKEIQGTMCSTSESVKYCEDIHVHQKAVLSTQENGKVSVEPGKNYCHGLIQKAVSHSPLKSQLGSGGNLPPDKTVSQKYVQSQTGPDLAESRETDEVVYNDAVLQISSVCTLVKGDAFYNSQIANIFNTSPLTSTMENDTSLKDSIRLLQCNDQQSGILKTESEPKSTEPELSLNVSEGNALLPSPCELSRAVEEILKSVPDLEMSQSYNNLDEMNKRNAEEGGNRLLLAEKKREENVSCGVDSTDVMNGNQELCQNIEDQFSSSTGDGLCIVNKESTAECVSTEENQEHFGSIAEAPVTLLSDQLNELSKEFPYGIGYMKTLNVTGNNDTMPKPNDTGNTENLQFLRKCHDPSGAIDQIKITMLNSEQMRKVFPERKKQFSNKSENSEVDCFKRDSEANLTRKNISRVTTDKAIAFEPRETASEKSFKREIPTYCCAEAWLATGYISSPCRCALVKGLGSKQKLDLCSQSETRVKCRPKPSDNSNVDFKLNSQLPISTLHTVSKTVSSGTQSVRTMKKISGPKNSNECKPHQIDQVVSLLEMLSLQNPKRNNKHIRNELSHHASSQEPVKSRVDTVRRQRTKIKHNTNCERYKVKQDSSETHMIKVPTLNKSLKRQKAVERKSKALAIQHNDAISASDLSSVGSFSQMCEKSQYISILHSQEPLNGNKFLNVMDLEKRYGYNKVEHKEGTDSEHH
ncbi:retroelement silencing factor 1 [Sceloporus undulatus]|uniref:retroelement silencing factor 1 n=1 Tax=Sceloporus undulatus TaxID=8520 RepID=UPI001C4DB6C8|nr:retroelement silencing factor 1 [Sceloporus undulatus]XP_042324656.1 retroelement silencing factor 1 [Sceloporus undulatus]XP_042324657.1 retroelement silencing factor 1 [Sceloporus undulatus]XP_042324658.1 retroelement silencing factor 1 [Sceloporus undulatus]